MLIASFSLNRILIIRKKKKEDSPLPHLKRAEEANAHKNDTIALYFDTLPFAM